jgi:H+-transporting ATPase
MSRLLHQRKGHQRRPAPDDVEANASNGGGSGSTAAADRLSEYAALERFISTYRDDGGAKEDADADQKARRRNPPWWKFWVSIDLPEGGEAAAAAVPDAWLTTDIQTGLRQPDVDERRKRFGWNELTTEKENMFAKFLTYFMGPILYGKWCSRHTRPAVPLWTMRSRGEAMLTR